MPKPNYLSQLPIKINCDSNNHHRNAQGFITTNPMAYLRNGCVMVSEDIWMSPIHRARLTFHACGLILEADCNGNCRGRFTQ